MVQNIRCTSALFLSYVSCLRKNETRAMNAHPPIVTKLRVERATLITTMLINLLQIAEGENQRKTQVIHIENQTKGISLIPVSQFNGL